MKENVISVQFIPLCPIMNISFELIVDLTSAKYYSFCLRGST